MAYHRELLPPDRPSRSEPVRATLSGSGVATVLRSGIPPMSGIDVFDPLPYVMAMAFFAAVVAVSILAPDGAPFVSTRVKRCSTSSRMGRGGAN